MSVSIDDLQKLMADIGADTRKHVEAKIAEAVAPLEKRIADLESRPPGLKYCGAWTEGTAYRVGDCVSKKGLWIAVVDTRARPGESPDWRLAVRDGKDGKDVVR